MTSGTAARGRAAGWKMSRQRRASLGPGGTGRQLTMQLTLGERTPVQVKEKERADMSAAAPEPLCFKSHCHPWHASQ